MSKIHNQKRCHPELVSGSNHNTPDKERFFIPKYSLNMSEKFTQLKRIVEARIKRKIDENEAKRQLFLLCYIEMSNGKKYIPDMNSIRALYNYTKLELSQNPPEDLKKQFLEISEILIQELQLEF